MQTFLPVESYRLSAVALDDRRLGKQRVEAAQIATAILDSTYGWQDHPAVEMWRGHGASLCIYGMYICMEWRYARGFKDTLLSGFRAMQYLMTGVGERVTKPSWVGDEAFHNSHMSNLLRKDPQWYEWMFPDTVPDNLPYVWPKGVARSGVVAEVTRKVASPITCPGGCGGRKRRGFTNRGTLQNPWWVCAFCLKPTERWFLSLGDDVLNFFRGGPVDGYVTTTKFLLSTEGLRVPVALYSWTHELITSPTTGKVARVWVYHSMTGPDTVVTTATPTTSSSQSTGVSAMSVESQETQVPWPVDPATGLPVDPNALPAAPAPAAEESAPAPAPAVAPVTAPDVSDLRPRRDAIKASRDLVAKEVTSDGQGEFTVAKLWRVENPTAKRTSPAEVARVRAALDRLEQMHRDAAAQQAAAAQAAAVAAPVAPAALTAEGQVADPS